MLLFQAREEARRIEISSQLAESGFLFSHAKDLYPGHSEDRILGETWPRLMEFERGEAP
jgi:hypothetical protein